MNEFIFPRNTEPGPDAEAARRKKRTTLALLALAAFLVGLFAALRLTRPKARLHAAGAGPVGSLGSPEEPVFGTSESEPWMKPVAGEDGAKPGGEGSPVGRDARLRPPEIGKVRSTDGTALDGGPMFYANYRDAPPDAPAAAGTGKEEASSANRAKKSPFPTRDEPSYARGGGLQPSAFGSQPGDAPAKDRLPSAAVVPTGPVKGSGPVARAAPVQKALPVSAGSGRFGPGGSSGLAGATASAGGAQAASLAATGPGAGWGAAQTGAPGTTGEKTGGGSWGPPIGDQGGDNAKESPPVKLKPIENVKKFWGLDLQTLYKKLRERGATTEQLRKLEDCLAGIGCTGGDIWEACTKATLFNICKSLCKETPGCVPPGTSPGPGPGPGPSTCTPEPGCLEAGTMVEVTTCDDQQIWERQGSCCSCGTSCYTTSDSSPNYANTGVNCHSSCPAGQFVHRFCSN